MTRASGSACGRESGACRVAGTNSELYRTSTPVAVRTRSKSTTVGRRGICACATVARPRRTHAPSHPACLRNTSTSLGVEGFGPFVMPRPSRCEFEYHEAAILSDCNAGDNHPLASSPARVGRGLNLWRLQTRFVSHERAFAKLAKTSSTGSSMEASAISICSATSRLDAESPPINFPAARRRIATVLGRPIASKACSAACNWCLGSSLKWLASESFLAAAQNSQAVNNARSERENLVLPLCALVAKSSKTELVAGLWPSQRSAASFFVKVYPCHGKRLC